MRNKFLVSFASTIIFTIPSISTASAHLPAGELVSPITESSISLAQTYAWKVKKPKSFTEKDTSSVKKLVPKENKASLEPQATVKKPPRRRPSLNFGGSYWVAGGYRG